MKILSMVDTFGKWFLEFEKRNEDCSILCGIYDATGGLELRQYPHSRYDGYSVALAWLQERGKLSQAQQFLDKTGGHMPSMLHLAGLINGLFFDLLVRPRPRRMKIRSCGWPEQPVSIDRQHIAWRILDESGTHAIAQQAAATGTGLNAWMVACALPHLAPLWAETKKKISCGITISLHRYMKFTLEPSNRFGMINLPVDESSTPVTINRQMREQLRKRRHLANWASYYLPDYFGAWYTQIMLRCIGFFQSRNFIFTNLGEVSGETGQPLFMIPPVLNYNPVSLGTMIWEGKTVLSLRFHPHLDITPGMAEQLIESWCNSLVNHQPVNLVATSASVESIDPARIRKMT